jgi:hypothetical protein
MVYLNVILTILCVILLSFLIAFIYLIKKYGKKLSNLSKTTSNLGGFPPLGNPKQMEESMKMIGNLMKNFPK